MRFLFGWLRSKGNHRQMTTLMGNCFIRLCDPGCSPSFPGYPAVPLPRSQLPAQSPCTWPAPYSGGVLLCAWRYCPPLPKQEGPDDHTTFGIQSRGFGTRSIRFVRPLRERDAMFASERLPTFLGWECLPTGYHLHVSSSFCWIPHVLLAGAMVNSWAIFRTR